MVRLRARPASPKLWLTYVLLLSAASATAARATLDIETALKPPVIASGSDPPTVSNRKSSPGRSPAEIPILNHEHPTPKFRDTNTNANREVEIYNALAPVSENAVRAPSPQSEEPRSGLSQLSSARLLQDWEADDIILLSTIDGALHARDRRTGRHRWTLEMPDSPMIETWHAVQNDSQLDEQLMKEQFVFIVEPSQDGQMYMQFADPAAGLKRIPDLSVKKMADRAPYAQELNGRTLATNGFQQTVSYTLDAETGEVLFPRSRSSDGSPPQPRCLPRANLDFEDGACKPTRTIRLGRKSYTFTLADEGFNYDFATIKFNEWVVNNANNDLQVQHDPSFGGYDVRVFHNGRFMFLDTELSPPKAMINEIMDSPVARVFDVIRPRDIGDDYSDLVLLQRDIGASSAQTLMWQDPESQKHRVFVNRTDLGQWYALSEQSYPGVTVNAGDANIQSVYYPGGYLNFQGDLKDIVGVHDLARNPPVPQLGMPRAIITEPMKDLVPPPSAPPASSTRSVFQEYLLTLVVTIIIGCMSGYSSFELWRTYLKQKQLPPVPVPVPAEKMSISEHKFVEPAAEDDPTSADPKMERLTPVHSRMQSVASNVSNSSTSASPKKLAKTIETAPENDSDGDSDEEEESNTLQDDEAAHKYKKTSRGRRGGKRRNKKNRSVDAADFEARPVLSIEKQLAGGKVQVGRLIYDSDLSNCLGQGSSGTAVFPGTFDGREVAVKRLVKSANSLAEKEIKHLVSSDENPHVIRYFGKEESLTFFYIALDRFSTSLDQFVEFPERFSDLVSPTKGYDIKDALRQITRGLQHIHSLKLVHRDIKPQNILVRPVKSLRPLPDGQLTQLLFVISDFGLCKPLEDGPESVYLATRTAAGTTGWKAPELLVSSRDAIAAPEATWSNDRDSPESDPTSSSPSKSITTSQEGTAIDIPTGRRATKAIDIFSLGCVFFYVMTRGGHPFDRGGSPLARDLNIKEGNFDTSALRSAWIEYDYDADDLIMQMITHNPRDRPDTPGILQHPYFWTMEQKLDFLCAVSDNYEERKQKITNIHDEYAKRTPEEVAILDEIAALQAKAPNVIGLKKDGVTIQDFLSALPRSFLNEMGKQRKYTGTKMIDLLRVIRNKKNHFHDLPNEVKEMMKVPGKGVCMEGYYSFWRARFPSLLVNCHQLVMERKLIGDFGVGRWYDGTMGT